MSRQANSSAAMPIPPVVIVVAVAAVVDRLIAEPTIAALNLRFGSRAIVDWGPIGNNL